MDVSVTICAGALSYDITVTDTGPDGLAETIREASVHFITVAGTEVGKSAAAQPPVVVEQDDD